MKASDFPPEVKACLWSYDISGVDLSKPDQRRRIIENILNRGTSVALDWLFINFTKKEISDVIAQSSISEWNKKSISLWSLIFGVVPSRASRFA
jgi:hypothetical protein